jgi:hypothetical protein
MGNTYWALFDARGRIAKVLLDGIHVKTDEQRQMLMREGYKNIDDETYNALIGNRGMGDNGTGYIRDPKTGKPVSAPAYTPTQEERANQLAVSYAARVQELNNEIVAAMADGDEDLITELKAEKGKALEAYQKALEEIKNA